MEVPWSTFTDTQRPIWYYLLILAAVGVCCESAFTWRCSPPTDNVFYFPDIPATVSDIESISQPSLYNAVYVYQVQTDSLNCSGIVTGVEYCYQPDNDPNGIASDVIFTLLIFDELSSSMTDMDITRIPIPTPGVNPNCSSSVCCDLYSFTGEGVSLHSDNFIYGILTPSSGHRLLGFHSSLTNFLVNGYFFTEGVLRLQPLNLPSPLDWPLRIVRLIVDQGSGPTTSTTDSTTPSNSDTGVTTQPAVMIQTTVNSSITDTPPTPSSATTSSQFQGEGNSVLPIAVGVAVGLSVLVVLLCMSVVIIVMCICRSRSEDRKLMSPNGNGSGSNDKSVVTTENPAYRSVVSQTTTNSEPLYANENTDTQQYGPVADTTDHKEENSTEVIMATNMAYAIHEPQQDVAHMDDYDYIAV